jgi:hypothetical protein
MNTCDCAYAGGFFDGEGSIIVHVMSEPERSPLLQLSISNTDPDVLIWFKSVFGGRVQEEKPHGCGKKRIWVWYLTKAEDIKAFFDSVLPYARIKRREMEIGLEMCELILQQKANGRAKITDRDRARRMGLAIMIRSEKLGRVVSIP